MGSEKELVVFVVLINAILIIFIVGFIFFFYQYRKRKIIHDQEMNNMIEKHNQELLLSQMKVQQQTMRDVGKEIHDNLGQKLTLASLYLHKVVRNLNDLNQEQIEEVNGLLEESLKEVRRLSVSLVKSDAKNLKLADIISNDLARIESLYNIETNFSFPEQPSGLTPFYIINIYRIVQEFIQNSIKHGNPKQINIDIDFDNKSLYLVCKDDGIGFDMNLVSKGNGLINIEQRAGDLSGTLEWQSSLDRGTMLLVKIPVS